MFVAMPKLVTRGLDSQIVHLNEKFGGGARCTRSETSHERLGNYSIDIRTLDRLPVSYRNSIVS